MKNKMTTLIMLFLCILSVFGSIHAQEIPVREEGKISLNNIRFYQGETEATSSLRQLLQDLTITYSSQEVPAPRKSFAISMGGTQLLDYELQSTTPYYVRTNFFGKDFYMIDPEDRFEEQVAEAVYNMVNSMSETPPENLPSLEEIYTSIQEIRDIINADTIDSAADTNSLSEVFDWTAFFPLAGYFMSRVESVDPLTEDHYLFTDIHHMETAYDWPDAAKLPQQKYTAAFTMVITNEDLLQLVNCLPEFFEDNPDYADSVIESFKRQLEQNSPEYTIPEGTDYLALFVDSLREIVQTELAGLEMPLRIDMAEGMSVGFVTLEIINGKNAGINTRLSYHATSDEGNKVYEIGADIIQGGENLPLLRAAAVGKQEESGTDSCNLLFTDYEKNSFEAVLQADTHINSLGRRFTDARLRFNLNDQEGDLLITGSDIENRFDKKDSRTEITYEHTSHGQPLFNMSLTASETFSDPLPALTPADAISVSEMTPEDYAALAQNIIMNIMMLAFSFTS